MNCIIISMKYTKLLIKIDYRPIASLNEMSQIYSFLTDRRCQYLHCAFVTRFMAGATDTANNEVPCRNNN